MPRPAPPLTPGSSTDIKGKDGLTPGFSQITFELPSPAIAARTGLPEPMGEPLPEPSFDSRSPRTQLTGNSRRRSSIATKYAFDLPPPPTRSRKIIQMKPKEQQDAEDEILEVRGKSAASAKPSKKQPSATSVAGRKMARKTAHSLIERRRRSKMNEEFGTLKDMIPACTGEMHKLAILQAAIEYVRYLEDCISTMKTQTGSGTPKPMNHSQGFAEFAPSNREEPSPEFSNGSDVEMEGSETTSPTYIRPVSSHRRSISPISLATSTLQHNSSSQSLYSSSTTSDRRHYSFSMSSATSPVVGAVNYDYARSIASVGSAFTSPALLPQSTAPECVSDRRPEAELEQQATTALLMLNVDQRAASRIKSRSGKAGGLSVRELLGE